MGDRVEFFTVDLQAPGVRYAGKNSRRFVRVYQHGVSFWPDVHG